MFERSNTTKTLKDYIWLKNEQFNVMGIGTIAAFIVLICNLLPCELFTLLTGVLRDFSINFILTFF